MPSKLSAWCWSKYVSLSLWLNIYACLLYMLEVPSQFLCEHRWAHLHLQFRVFRFKRELHFDDNLLNSSSDEWEHLLLPFRACLSSWILQFLSSSLSSQLRPIDQSMCICLIDQIFDQIHFACSPCLPHSYSNNDGLTWLCNSGFNKVGGNCLPSSTC
jgi:hypothetical protein